MKTYKSYSLRNIDLIPQLDKLSQSDKKGLNIVGTVLPFKTNSY